MTDRCADLSLCNAPRRGALEPAVGHCTPCLKSYIHWNRSPGMALSQLCIAAWRVVMPAAQSELLKPLMLHALVRNWWLLLLRGIAAVVFGILTFVWPGMTLLTLVILYGSFALVDGVIAVAAGAVGGKSGPRWWLIFAGLLGIAIGVVTLAWPDITALVLLLFIAGWAIGTGVLQIAGAIRLRKEINNEWLLIASGALSILFGIVLAAQPDVGALALLFVIGMFAVLYGILLITLAFRLRSHAGAQN